MFIVIELKIIIHIIHSIYWIKWINNKWTTFKQLTPLRTEARTVKKIHRLLLSKWSRRDIVNIKRWLLGIEEGMQGLKILWNRLKGRWLISSRPLSLMFGLAKTMSRWLFMAVMMASWRIMDCLKSKCSIGLKMSCRHLILGRVRSCPRLRNCFNCFLVPK